MEVYNAIELFKRSTLWGFRYNTYISDGDSKVFNKLREAENKINMCNVDFYSFGDYFGL